MSLYLKSQQLLGSGGGIFKELSPPIPQVRFNPGHQAALIQNAFDPITGTTPGALRDSFDSASGTYPARNVDTTRIADARALSGNPVKVVKIIKYWRYWEGPTEGDYGRMRSLMDAYLNMCTTGGNPPCKLLIDIWPVVFASTTSNIFPEYYLSSGDYEPTNNGYVADYWNAATMDKLIALYNTIADEYGNESAFEGISTMETAISFSSVPGSYTNAKLLTEFKRMISEFRANHGTLSLYVSTNYLGTNAQAIELLEHMRDNFCVGGGPDTWGHQWIESQGGSGHRALQFDQLYRGEGYGGSGPGTDYRNTLRWKNEVQNPEFGGYMTDEDSGRGPFSCQEVWDTGYTLNRANYFCWEQNTTYGGPGQKWSTGMVPFMQANPNTVTDDPYT